MNRQELSNNINSTRSSEKLQRRVAGLMLGAGVLDGVVAVVTPEKLFGISSGLLVLSGICMAISSRNLGREAVLLETQLTQINQS
jgi:hypothetical protein